jgi:hypothetical protein
MIERLWVLGAADPEMNAIHGLLTITNETFTYAMKFGKRVNSFNAYKADQINAIAKQYIFVECSAKLPDTIYTTLKIDHHHEGDPGYAMHPSNYMLGSSLGQVLLTLGLSGKFISINDNIQMTAAADHCLYAAYQGQCPGVDPEKLKEWRMKSRSEYQNRSINSIRADVFKAKEAFKTTSFIQFKGTDSKWYDVYLFETTMPELPEAAAQLGKAFTTTLQSGHKRKEVLMSAPAPLVEAWMLHKQHILKGVYGCPMRGYAGGYCY